jgi:hypothetical protein
MKAGRVGYWHPAHGYENVKSGFSWPAFFLGPIWAIVKRLWWIAAAMMVIDAALWFASGYAAARRDGAIALLYLVLVVIYAVLRGRWGNGWRRARLMRRGYRPMSDGQDSARGGSDALATRGE